jgi:dipeptidase
MIIPASASHACTNFLVTKGASVDGSTMISYAADSHVLFGELYHWPAADYPEGTMLDVYDWDSGKYLGQIPQVTHTYNVVGNINEHQLAIGETTYGGRPELKKQPGAIMDYGSLMYIALQRAKTAREAIQVITDLVAEYGYYSSGESFSIADKEEVWILEMIGKGAGEKGAVWVAQRIPDGYVSGHANQARITTFPKNDPENCLYAEDVIEFARKKGYYKGSDKKFSFSDTYAPMDFGAARFCESRVWSMFNKVKDGMEVYEPYILGHDLEKRMPLWVKPEKKVSVQDMFAFMRDHFEGTVLDMTKDVGAGSYKVPYRWRPLTWEVDGEKYCNERAVATQQTGFSFISQSRSWLEDPIGGILWFGVDDAGSTVYSPMYCGMTEVPHCYAVGNGSMMEFTPDAGFWVFNQVSNFAYTRYNLIHPDIESRQKELENKHIASVKAIDQAANEIYQSNPDWAVEFLTDFSVSAAERTVESWKELYGYLFAKYMDGNLKRDRPVPDDHKYITPEREWPGYDETYYRRVIEDTGDHLKVKEESH